MFWRLIPLVAFAGPVFAQQSGFPAGPVNCAIRPMSVVEIAAPVPGIVKEIRVRPGQEVRRGDVLAVFDQEVAAAELALAEARAEDTSARDAAIIRRDGMQKKVERLDLAKLRRAISEAEFESAVLELATAESEVRRQDAALRLSALEAERYRTVLAKSVVTSPVDGVVGEDPIDPGESPTSKPIVTLYVVKPLRVEAYVPTLQLPAFLDRSDFSVIVSGDQSNPVPVALDHVSQVADLSSDTQSVFFLLEAPGILPGYKCQMVP
jgi:multidrug efflux pump subunit AcrA (membrane-fusion protein)